MLSNRQRNIYQFFTVIYKPKQFETPDIKRFTDKPTVVRPTFINYSRLPIELHPYSRKIQKKRKFKPKILPQEIPTEENAELETKGIVRLRIFIILHVN